MANTLITNQIIARLAVREFKNNLVLARTVDRQYQNVFSNDTGRQIRIRLPVRLLPTPGPTANIQNINQRFTTLTIDQRWHVAVSLTDEQLTLELNDFNASVIKPAMQTLANLVDASLYARAIDFYNYVGTAGQSPATYAVPSKANAVLNSIGIPRDSRYMMVSDKDGDALRQGMTGYFDPSFVDPILKEATMGRVAGFSVYNAQNVQCPTVNTLSGTPAVNGVNQTGNMLVINGLSAGQTVTRGTVFSIAGVNSVNRVSYNDTKYLANFVVTQTVSADGGGNLTLPIAPSIVPMGQYQNVTGSPASGALLTFQPKHTINVAYHKQAFTLAMINLYTPKKQEGVYAQNMVDPDANISMRMLRSFDILQSADIVRFDVLFGIQTFPEWAVRVMGGT